MKVLGLLVSFGLFASTARLITFDSAAVGKTPPGWIVATTNHRGGPARWEIRADESAPTRPYVMAQVSPDAGGGVPLAILDKFSLRDGDVSVRIKPVGGHSDQAGGLVWRYRDENNYYLVRADALSRTVAVFKVLNGQVIPIAGVVKHDVPRNDWSTLKVSAHGRNFQIYVDHRRVVQGADDTFTGWGRVGLATSTDSITYFDDFRVNPR